MKKETLEKYQVCFYIAAILVGFTIGSNAPSFSTALEDLLWPVLGVLLYITFTQVPLTSISSAFKDQRFFSANLFGNFVVLPMVVGALALFLPNDPSLRLGFFLVLLVPCTDWFITFAHLGRANAAEAIAVTPVNLIVQIALTPIYLWLFLGNAFLEIFEIKKVALVFFTLIAIPLFLAFLTEHWAERETSRNRIIVFFGWLPVPLLAFVVFLISASQAPAIAQTTTSLLPAIFGFLVFLLVVPFLGVAIGRAFKLNPVSTRTLIFSLGTRNSFVVLPLALVLPIQWESAILVIVYQSIVELLGMIFYVWIIPRTIK